MGSDGSVALGIDLGTTNTAAAVFDGERVEMVRTSDGSHLTPSVVRFDAKGRVSVGTRARRFLDRDPDNTRSEFKRLMGTEKRLRFPAAGFERTPEELSAEVLRSVRADVQEQLGFLPERAVISVPALFELPQAHATSEAARLAGFERVELIQEPVASALAAGWSTENDTGGSWLVYDLGGGTFDVSLLETRDGLLRVVGHDGDNFLGGRDIDLAIVGWVAERLAAEGHAVDRANPEHAVALRLLRSAAEEAKIELTRRTEATLQLPELLEIDGEPVDVDLVLTRATLEALMAPLVDRTVSVCGRLLARHGLEVDQLVKIVMVGGPTVMPFLRDRVQATLPVPFAEQLDPMTLVARGASLYAATAGLDARPRQKTATGRRLWLQYPAMSSDLTPFVAGRLLDGPEKAPAEVRFVRGDDGFSTEWTRFGADGALVAMLELAARKPNLFRIEGRDAQREAVPVLPPSITIVQGMTVTDPPLSRSVGVALASDAVQVYLQRGTPLPARRTFVHQTIETMSPAAGDGSLSIPIVQGELPDAHLCRLVGRLEIRAAELKGPLAAGSDVEVTVEVDRGGRLSARALVPRLSQVFEQVARLVVPHADPAEMKEQLQALRSRLVEARSATGEAAVHDRLFDVEWWLQDADLALTDARGGDDDAAQKARRLLLDAHAALDDLAEQSSWPELDLRAVQRVASASRWVAELGTEQEQRMLAEASAGVERARTARRAQDLERHLGIVRQLSSAAYYRHPDAWRWEFEHAASDIGSATDLAEAERLVREGRANLDDRNRLREIVQRLWSLVPRAPTDRSLGYGSGLR